MMPAQQETRSRPVLDDLLACPSCRGRMRREDTGYACPGCGTTYPVADGIPVFVKEDAALHDELDHLHAEHTGHDGAGHGHKAEQSAFYDRAELAEFEIERPLGAPRLYRYFLAEKFRRSVEPFDGRLDGWTALTVCGGSGMDAEFLARAGATVISSDLSIGAAQRAMERARRHRCPIAPIVADVEHLPFADHSVDLVYVHDGLHHLENPSAGLAEMARVARRAVCVNEPSRAAATQLGVRFGLALEREEAGNRVARLVAAETAAILESKGFDVVRADRYAMYYHHVPGRMMELLSRPLMLPLAVTWWRIVNRVVGRFGNKLTVVALRGSR